MFGRTLGLVLVKRKYKNVDQVETVAEPMDLEDISDQLVSTASKLATVAVVTVAAVAAVRVAEHAAKIFIR